ncbi:hypothetical protein EJB05_56807, partial [Eragrostis curvula]
MAATFAMQSNWILLPSEGSMIASKPSLLVRRELAHATKFSCPGGLDISTGFLPLRKGKENKTDSTYPKVPITRVEICSFPSPKAVLARPKSDTFGVKSYSNKMLLDLKSRSNNPNLENKMANDIDGAGVEHMQDFLVPFLLVDAKVSGDAFSLVVPQLELHESFHGNSVRAEATGKLDVFWPVGVGYDRGAAAMQMVGSNGFRVSK